jgi:uncharacterized protein (TIGR02391 family)
MHSKSSKKHLTAAWTFWSRLRQRFTSTTKKVPTVETSENLHPKIHAQCSALFGENHLAEAVEKAFKVVRSRLRELTSYETAADSFGRGGLYIDGAAAPHVDADFQQATKFLMMSIDFFRNEKAHTCDGNISDPLRACEYLALASLAMHHLDNARINGHA